ncbi:MAG TPA: archaemetzincin [Chitinophagales bacterium]|nr:archaemetzincin [Chitinophagales bacterium]
MRNEKLNHYQKVLLLLLLSSCCLIIACNEIKTKNKEIIKSIQFESQNLTKNKIELAIQPLAFSDTSTLNWIKQNIKNYYQFNVIILPNITLPKQAFYKPRNRYRADTIIRFLRDNKPNQFQYIIGFTANDISATKNEYPDFGIMGLGFVPGPSCVVSTYRLKTSDDNLLKERIAKVVLHEIGHNLGLPHCTNYCFMHAAEASIKQVDAEPLDLCKECKKNINFLE